MFWRFSCVSSLMVDLPRKGVHVPISLVLVLVLTAWSAAAEQGGGPVDFAPGRAAEMPAEAGKTPDQLSTEDEPEFPRPKNIELLTRDGLKMAATYYPGTKGKDSVAIVMLHDWKWSRKDFEELALHLQSKGHAVIAPDLRGHGDSTKILGPGMRKPRVLNAEKLKKTDVFAMSNDVGAVKQFLKERNDAEELNIDKTCVVGIGTAAVLALNWTVMDWNARQLPLLRQGRDIKALVLISPESLFRGVSAKDALKHPAVCQVVSFLVIVGKKDDKALRLANTLYTAVAKRADAGKKDKKDEKNKRHFFVAADTSLQGTDLLTSPEFNVMQQIAGFVELRVASRKSVWQKRRVFD